MSNLSNLSMGQALIVVSWFLILTAAIGWFVGSQTVAVLSSDTSKIISLLQ